MNRKFDESATEFYLLFLYVYGLKATLVNN